MVIGVNFPKKKRKKNLVIKTSACLPIPSRSLYIPSDWLQQENISSHFTILVITSWFYCKVQRRNIWNLSLILMCFNYRSIFFNENKMFMLCLLLDQFNTTSFSVYNKKHKDEGNTNYPFQEHSKRATFLLFWLFETLKQRYLFIFIILFLLIKVTSNDDMFINWNIVPSQWPSCVSLLEK